VQTAAGSRDKIIHRAAIEEHAHVRTRKYVRSLTPRHLYTYTHTWRPQTHHSCHPWYFRIYERGFRGKDKQPFKCLLCRDNFLTTDVTMESGVRCLFHFPFDVVFSLWKFNEPITRERKHRDFTNDTLSAKHVSVICRETKLVRSCRPVCVSRSTRKLLSHRYLSVNLENGPQNGNRWLNFH